MEGIGDDFGEDFAEVGPVDAGFVGGFDIAGAGGGAGVEEVAKELGGGVVVAAAEFEGALFEGALEVDAAEGIFVGG